MKTLSIPTPLFGTLCVTFFMRLLGTLKPNPENSKCTGNEGAQRKTKGC